MSEWQPIETAPKDGTYVLLHTDESTMPVIAQWIFWNGTFAWRDEYEEAFSRSTNWMPLPAPPVQP